MNTHSFNQFDKENEAPNANLLPVTPTPRRLGFLTSNQSNTPVTRPQSLPTKKSSKTWLNGYQVKPKTPSYAPYKDVSSRGKKGADALSSAVHSKDLQPLKPLKALDDRQWNHLATQQKLIRPEHALAGFQIEAANYVTQQAGDLVVIAPTGAGKSLTWVLPLIARNEGISLVIVPFTSLGHQGEQRHYGTSVGCTFIHSKSKSLASLRSALNATGPHVIYICPEMLEGPRVAQVLHTARFKSKLSAIYIDEAHCVHENKDWRPAYGRLKLLRKVVGTSIPLVCLSATLPQSYCDSLETNAALSANYHLINLGNFRPELSIIVHRMEYQAGTFQDLRFLLPWNSTHASVVRTIVYCDDISMLTAMFWWFEGQLIELNLPKFYIDILHASLSEEHQKKADNDFRNGRTRILLGTEKIGLGMGYEGVQVVVQYKCRDLTLVQWEQRRGRGAQRAGETAVGIIMVEKTMTDDDGSLSVTSPKQEDPGLLDLIQNTSKCKQAIVDHWLRHPSRPAESCQRCSHCNPQLRVAKELTWIMEDPSAEQANAIPSVNDLDQSPPTSSTEPNADKAAEEIFEMLKEWRMKEWRENWTKWRRYGPENIVNDADLLDLSKRARQITTLDELFAHSHIPHWPRVCDALFAALCDATAVVWGSGFSSESLNIPESDNTGATNDGFTQSAVGDD